MPIPATSGTTGTPKGAELTHSNLLGNVEVSVGLFGLDAHAVTLGALPSSTRSGRPAPSTRPSPSAAASR